ncbi:MAG: alanine--tRNA ligase-related protein [Candidatus Buchananbacteria bacterium]
MNSNQLKQKYLDFFQSQGHTVIPSASLVPQNDPTVLFTTAGMHPLVPYLLGEKHPGGTRLTDVQKCIRTVDIDNVGDNTHLTFFEMLGNWSLGDYWKDQAIKMSFDFLTKKLQIPLDQLAVTCFAGEPENKIPKDEQSAKIWQNLGVKKERIAFLGREDNWWGPAGQTGPCGPDTEMFFWTGKTPAPKNFDPTDKLWVEIWNDVFMQYNKTAAGNYEELKQKNVDTGMGLERTTAVLNGWDNVFATDLFVPIMAAIKKLAPIENEKSARIIADHLRAAVFILGEGIEPSNLDQGYVLRRLIRRAIRHGKVLGIIDFKESKANLDDKKSLGHFIGIIAKVIIEMYSSNYPELEKNKEFILDQLVREETKFSKTLEEGLGMAEKIFASKKSINKEKFDKIKKETSAERIRFIISNKYKDISAKELEEATISGEELFLLYQSYGFPIEIIEELAEEKRLIVAFRDFTEEFEKHQQLSRTATEGRFKGGLADNSELTAKMHTATHLMLAALRQVLGDQVFQKGSNITPERIRFDFSYSEKMTPEQINQVENLVNEQIKKNLPVVCEEMDLGQAKKANAMGVFENKYGNKVKVYSIKDFSKEICGGPHAKNTGELGHFKILKEESSSSGVRRIKAILD